MQPPWHWLHSGRNTQKGYWGGYREDDILASAFAVDTLGQFVCSKCRTRHESRIM